MQGAISTIQDLRDSMARVAGNIENTTMYDVQKQSAEVCIFRDAHIEDADFGDTLRLAGDMATQCIEASTWAMAKNRFMGCYACIVALADN